MISEVIIAGQPNCGKSTVFNGLTGASARVGNWHGVTVVVESKFAVISGKKYRVYD